MVRIAKLMENARGIVPWVSEGLHLDQPGDCLQRYVCLFPGSMSLQKKIEIKSYLYREYLKYHIQM